MFDAVELIGKIAGKMLPKKLFDRPLPEQVAMQRSLMPLMGKTPEERLINARAFLLKAGGLPMDIKDLLKKGKTKEEVKDYYWMCEEFKEFWAEIEMTEGMLDDLIKTALRKEKV